MSNEYIVVNTTTSKTDTVWSTLATTYLPKKGEVCIIVPTVSSLGYVYNEDEKGYVDIDNTNEKVTDEDILNRVSVGIKIGNGK